MKIGEKTIHQIYEDYCFGVKKEGGELGLKIEQSILVL